MKKQFLTLFAFLVIAFTFSACDQAEPEVLNPTIKGFELVNSANQVVYRYLSGQTNTGNQEGSTLSFQMGTYYALKVRWIDAANQPVNTLANGTSLYLSSSAPETMTITPGEDGFSTLYGKAIGSVNLEVGILTGKDFDFPKTLVPFSVIGKVAK